MSNRTSELAGPMQDIRSQPQWREITRVRIAYHNLATALGGASMAAAVLAVLLWPVADRSKAVFWLGCAATLGLLTLLTLQRFKAAELSIASPRPWSQLFHLGALLFGLLWGAVSIWGFPAESLQHQVLIAFVLAGICGGALTIFAPMPVGFSLFTTTALMPYILQILLTGMPGAIVISISIIFFQFITNRAAWRMSETLGVMLDQQVTNAELAKSLHHKATHDSLVDLINHGEFQRRLHRLTKKTDELPQDFSLIFVDLDLFKNINDSAGHAAGDMLLREIADILRRHTRSRDTAARIGGDEFAVLLESCSGEHALDIAETLRSEIAAMKFKYNGQEFEVGASLGVTSSRSGRDNAERVLAAADAACYAAKEAGRNRVRLFSSGDAFKTTGRFQLVSDTAG